jgi:hypothetical protein
VGAIRDAVSGDSLEQLRVELMSVPNTAVGSVSNNGLESLEDLNRWLELMVLGGMRGWLAV